MGGGAPREVLENVTGADWGPDGTSIAVLRASGSRERIEFPIGTPLYESISLKHLRVSPSGDLVAFSEHPLAGDFRGDIAVVDRTGRKTTLSGGWADIRGLAWSPDGREIWFTATRAGAKCSLWAVTPRGEERPVFRGPESLAVQDVEPNGRALVVNLKPPMQATLLPTGPGQARTLPRGPLVQIHGGASFRTGSASFWRPTRQAAGHGSTSRTSREGSRSRSRARACSS